MQSEGTEKSSKTKFGKEYWLYHLKKSQSYKGTESDYCQEHNLKRSSFSGAKKRYKDELTKSSKKFTSLKLEKNLLPIDQAPSFKSLPSPEWTAKFIKELLK